MCASLRTIALRLSTLCVFAVVGSHYAARPDLGTVVGVVGTALVALAAWWRPRRDLALWQLLVVLVGTPVALFYESQHHSAAKQLVGGLLFRTGASEALAIVCAAIAVVLALICSVRVNEPLRRR